MSGREGPGIELVASCCHCLHCKVSSGSGAGRIGNDATLAIYCAHPAHCLAPHTADLGRYVGQSHTTPGWCPMLPLAISELLMRTLLTSRPAAEEGF